MAIKADLHLHSNFSSDSDTKMEDMIKKGIELGLTHMCFTEHMDIGFPKTADSKEGEFFVNTDSYLYELLKYREQYKNQIKLLFGIELGLQTHCRTDIIRYAKNYDFDFIIGSTHLCNSKDPYYPSFFEGRSEEEAYREYFNRVLDNMKTFHNIDVCGHLDYVVRYGPNKDAEYTYERYQDILDSILMVLLENEKGLEVNTGSIRKGLRELHPLTAVLKRYKELGGEIVTIGSDAHTTDRIADGFDRACQILKDCGFKYFTIFENRLPEYIKL